MKHYLLFIFLTLSFCVKGQKGIYHYFNDAGFCGPGTLITEELTLFEDNSFKYTSFQFPNLRIEASGHFFKGNKIITLKYQSIKIDTLDKSIETQDVYNLQFISELKIINDKEWVKNKSGMLIECGKLFGSRFKILEPRKRRILTIRTIDYKTVNKLLVIDHG